MGLVTYPLNNIDYTAEDAELYHCTRTSGVFAADEDFSAQANGTDNNVTIGEGIAWVRNSRFSGKVVANKSAVVLDMGLSDGTYSRIDAIVLQFDANKNQTDIIKKEGTAASSPVAPEVVRTETLYELHLYHVMRRAGATSILQSDITDLRSNANYCGVMSDEVTILGEEFIGNDKIGVAGGVASLDSSGKIPSNQLPTMNYIPSSQKGAANGVAPLNANKKIDSSLLPLSSSTDSNSEAVAATAKAVKSAYDLADSASKAAESANETISEIYTDIDENLGSNVRATLYAPIAGQVTTCTIDNINPNSVLYGIDAVATAGFTSHQLPLIHQGDLGVYDGELSVYFKRTDTTSGEIHVQNKTSYDFSSYLVCVNLSFF